MTLEAMLQPFYRLIQPSSQQKLSGGEVILLWGATIVHGKGSWDWLTEQIWYIVYFYCAPSFYTFTAIPQWSSIVHLHCCAASMYTSTVHLHFAPPLLCSFNVHIHCTPSLCTFTVHPHYTCSLYTSTVHLYCPNNFCSSVGTTLWCGRRVEN